ncbi:MAG TPA: gluconokinase [Candidatus Acidoferrales bacterium]|nr:gluconokinase [Candidatus Acidoferrales bacterium]
MVIILMGVSGAGKTVVGQALAARLGWAFEDADNRHPAANVAKMRSGIPLNDVDREPWLEALNRGIREWIASGRNTILACSALKARYRETLRSQVRDAEAVRFVSLRATYEQIDARLRERRGHYMPESLLESQFDALEEPSASEALIVDASQTIPTVVNEIIARLHLTAPSTGPC